MQKGFLVYYDILNSLELLNDAECGQVFRSIVRYASLGQLPEGLPPAPAMLFSVMQQQIDRDAEKYRQICYARSKAGKKGKLASMAANSDNNEYNTVNQSYSGNGDPFDFYRNQQSG